MRLRDTAPRLYLRERAAAVLRVAAGESANAVAQQGILRPRRAQTVQIWVRRYLARGVAGLSIQAGRGRKPAFSPLTAAEATGRLLHLLHRAPQQCGVAQTRWTLATLAAQCPWLRLTTKGGLSQLLDRLDLSWQRARSYIHSPDPDYEAKLADVARARVQAAQPTSGWVLIYVDEVTIYRQPTLAPVWGARHEQPLARRSLRSDTPTRVLGGLDAQTGQVIRLRASHIGVAELVRFYQRLVAAYPPGTHFAVVQDNWPVHWHPDLLVALEPQQTPWPRTLPPSWPTTPSPAAVHRWGQLQLPIQIVPLPTYASWLNPIEKLWRLLRQELTHVHPYANDLPGLRAAIDTLLDGFATGSQRLLQYVGLAPGATPCAA